ncbi:MAG: hypothetical protein SWJ54_16540 [Cyanobacteriota bacterium]|nr:hypothetical protein [Cyanobacteriota bacterium]
MITLSIPWQFYLLLHIKANDANHFVKFKIDHVELSLQYQQLASYVHHVNRLKIENAHIFRGVKKTAEDLKEKIIQDLGLGISTSESD